MAGRHRVAFSLRLPSGSVPEYARRHAELWPQLRAAIAEQGGHNFTIFAVPAIDRVFGYLEVDDPDRWAAGAGTELTRRWWRYMAEIMPAHEDGSPIGDDVIEVFHQE
jgi:L-rhamnose mutarotase